MQLKMAPAIDLRYWILISIASICGANVGDITRHALGKNAFFSLAMLPLPFILPSITEWATVREYEICYWATVLILRAAATNIADFLTDQSHFTYIEASTVLTVFLTCLIGLGRKQNLRSEVRALPNTDARYWLTMLTAGSLGTVVADGIGHSFLSVRIGVPLSASLAVIVLILTLGVRARFDWNDTLSYWLALVAVRWSGTSIADISAYLLSLFFSAALSGFLFFIIFIRWKPRR